MSSTIPINTFLYIYFFGGGGWLLISRHIHYELIINQLKFVLVSWLINRSITLYCIKEKLFFEILFEVFLQYKRNFDHIKMFRVYRGRCD